MKFATKSRNAPVELPGTTGQTRVGRRTRTLLSRIRPGEIAVVDHRDMDRATAQRLVDLEVAAVLNAAPMTSGRYPNLGPGVLAGAGIPMVDELGPEIFAAVKDGTSVRIHDGVVHVGEQQVQGRELTPELVADQLAAARTGLAHQLESFTHNSTEFLRREQEVLLHGEGVPALATPIEDRPVVVVVPGGDHVEQLRSIRRFVREVRPVLIGVDRGADALVAAGLDPDVVVVSADCTEDEMPSAKAVRACRDLVVRVDRGSSRAVLDRWEKLGARPAAFETSATSEDVALVLADARDASTIVGVGLHATLDEFLDRQRAGLASTFLTRLKVGPRLVDAAAVPLLYSGQVRPRHLVLLVLFALLTLAVAIATTPVGQEWFDTLAAHASDLVDRIQERL